MKNVQQSNSGEYTCRANTEGRGIYSNKATLSVRGMTTCMGSTYLNTVVVDASIRFSR